MISIVICSINPGKLARAEQDYRAMLGGEAIEVVAIEDARSLAEGYNRGLRQSRGQIVIFSHDDVRFLCEQFEARLRGHLAQCDLLGVAGTDRVCSGNWAASGPGHVFGQVIHPHPGSGRFTLSIFGAPRRRIDGIQALDGLFLCCRREVAQAIGFDEKTFDGFHGYDMDFSFRAFLAGYRIAVCCDLDVLHESGGRYDEQFSEYRVRFEAKHLRQLAEPTTFQFQWAGAVIRTCEQAVSIMRPRYWDS